MNAETTQTGASSLIANRRIAFVGKLGGVNRKEARAMVRSQGGVMADRIDPSVDLIVIGADEILIDGQDELLEDWVLQAAADGKLKIIDETRLWQELGLVEEDWDACRVYTPAMLAKLLDVPITTIRRWHRRGLIIPVRQVNRLPYFDFQEVATARRIAGLVAGGALKSSIESKLSRLAQLYPNLHRPLSQLSVIVEGRHILLRKGEGLVEPGGQRRIDFGAMDRDTTGPDGMEPVLSLEEAKEDQTDRSVASLSTREEFLELAIEFEDSNEFDSAAEVYRAMGLAFGPNADLCFRLAEILYHQGQLEAARERYYMAVELEPEFVEARASLGCLLVELGQSELAISAFRGALDHHPDYPDVHFHLARLYDELERHEDAECHWSAFLTLAPQSPWASEARERLEATQHESM
jgi:tetratricopeptide (TPR) repeat protein